MLSYKKTSAVAGNKQHISRKILRVSENIPQSYKPSISDEEKTDAQK